MKHISIPKSHIQNLPRPDPLLPHETPNPNLNTIYRFLPKTPYTPLTTQFPKTPSLKKHSHIFKQYPHTPLTTFRSYSPLHTTNYLYSLLSTIIHVSPSQRSYPLFLHFTLLTLLSLPRFISFQSLLSTFHVSGSFVP